MSFLEKLRLPYRDDTAFGFLAIGVFLVPLVFSINYYENFEAIKFSLFLLCVGGSMAAFLFSQKTPSLSIKAPKYFYWLLSAFGFWAILCSFFAQDSLYAVFGFYYRYTSGLVFFAAFLVFIFLLINLANEEKLKFLLKIIVFDGLLVALVAYFESFGWILYQGPDLGAFFHSPSLLGNTDFSAMFLSCTLPLAIYFLITNPSLKAKIYYGFCIFWTIFASLILASRGGLLAMGASIVVALFLLAIYKFPKKFFLTLVLASLVLGVACNFFLEVSRPNAITSILTNTDSNTSSRLYAWEVSIKGILEHPLVGFGPGNYTIFFEHNAFPNPAAQIGIFDDAHNLFLQLGVAGGLPLLLLFLAIIFLTAWYGLKQLSKNKSLLVVALLSSLAAWLAGASFNPVPIPMYLFLSVLMAALLLPSASIVEIKLAAYKRILLLISAWLLVYWGAVNFVSEPLLGFGSRAYLMQNYKQAYTLDAWAFALNPANTLPLNYKTASEIRLGYSREVIIGDIKKIENLHKAETASYVTASNLYSLLYSLKNNKDDLQSAISAMQTALQIDPLFSPRYGQLALYYYQLGDIDASKQAIEQDLRLNNQDVSAWVLLARLYQLENNRTGTIFALTRAFKLNPTLQFRYFLYLAKALPDIRRVPIQIIGHSADL